MGVGNCSVLLGLARLAGKRFGCALFDWQVVALFFLTPGVLTVRIFYWFVLSFAVLLLFALAAASPVAVSAGPPHLASMSKISCPGAASEPEQLVQTRQMVYIGLLQRGGQCTPSKKKARFLN